ncbi:hypothetical protein ACFB49_39800 [Sphingomonas sp. DBB INV C78]|uniref:VOC family protein n=1 Tax=Sphingomonas sp. DBB INV C78 TaxID=3349434 RepID=UPI0036D33F13
MQSVPDVEAEQRRLAAKGVDVSEIRAESWGRYTMVGDPDGNRWVVAQLFEE